MDGVCCFDWCEVAVLTLQLLGFVCFSVCLDAGWLGWFVACDLLGVVLA